MVTMRRVSLSAGAVVRRLLSSVLLGVALGAVALALSLLSFPWQVGLSVLAALLLPLPGMLFAREDTPGAANAPGTFLSLLGLAALVGGLVALREPLRLPLGGHIVLIFPFLLALLAAYMRGAHGRKLRSTWPLGAAVGLAAWVGFALLMLVLASSATLSALAALPRVVSDYTHGEVLPWVVGLVCAGIGGVCGACLRVLPAACATCADDVAIVPAGASRSANQ